MRVGIGYDIHAFKEGRPLVLGGVEIPSMKGLEGHSDGDALLHAIADAILGAMGEKDIGEYFPDNNVAYQNYPSIKILRQVAELAEKRGFTVINVDSVLVMEEPRLVPFKEKMRETIASALSSSKSQINIKAKTNEGLGVVGRGEAVICYATVLLDQQKGNKLKKSK